MFDIGPNEGIVIAMVLFVAAVLAGVFLVWRAGMSAQEKDSDLTRCPQCGREISREYASCPECGHIMPSANDVSGQLVGRQPRRSA